MIAAVGRGSEIRKHLAIRGVVDIDTVTETSIHLGDEAREAWRENAAYGYPKRDVDDIVEDTAAVWKTRTVAREQSEPARHGCWRRGNAGIQA